MYENEREIQDLIDNQIEESINLDYKRGDSLLNTPSGKKEIAKDVSAFANSDGGTIIYGMDENNHVASSIVPVDGNVITKEWLEQVINSNIQRRISDIVITPVRIGGNISTTVYVVTIPRSLEAPHMTSAKRYYKRFNFESVEMEEYEIRNLYLRVNAAVLIIDEVSAKFGYTHWSGTKPAYRVHQEVELTFWIKNVGRSIDHYFKLEIETDLQISGVDEYAFSKNLILSESDKDTFTFANHTPIFPEESYIMVKGKFTIQERQNLQELKDKVIKCKLYYSNGIEERIFKIGEVLSNNSLNIEALFRK